MDVDSRRFSDLPWTYDVDVGFYVGVDGYSCPQGCFRQVGRELEWPLRLDHGCFGNCWRSAHGDCVPGEREHSTAPCAETARPLQLGFFSISLENDGGADGELKHHDAGSGLRGVSSIWSRFKIFLPAAEGQAGVLGTGGGEITLIGQGPLQRRQGHRTGSTRSLGTSGVG